MLHCQGCHGAAGDAGRSAGMPALRGLVDSYVRPSGRLADVRGWCGCRVSRMPGLSPTPALRGCPELDADVIFDAEHAARMTSRRLPARKSALCGYADGVRPPAPASGSGLPGQSRGLPRRTMSERSEEGKATMSEIRPIAAEPVVRPSCAAAIACMSPRSARGRRAGAAVERSFMEEIVVTAQKREQAMQDVGIAVTAVTGEQMRTLGYTNAQEITALAPGVSTIQPNGEANYAIGIRGVANNDFTTNVESPIAVVRRRGLHQPDVGDGLHAVRHGTGRDPARTPGHAVRAQRHRRARAVRVGETRRASSAATGPPPTATTTRSASRAP